MAALAASIADTITGVERLLNQDHFSSDPDELYLQPSNRGNKLKRKAHFISSEPEGRVNGRNPYRKTIQHAGYTRDIICPNPKRYDEDGDELATDDEDEEADARAAEENPYAGIRLEKLLMPLTSAAALPEHPSMSVPYLSTTLGDMAQHACEVVQRERKTLCNARKMLMKLRGDPTWIPCGMMEAGYDDEIFDTSKVYDMIISSAPTDGVNVGEYTTSNDVSGNPNRANHFSRTEHAIMDVLAPRNDNEDLGDVLFPRGNSPIQERAPNSLIEDAKEIRTENPSDINATLKRSMRPEETIHSDDRHERGDADMIINTTAVPDQALNMQVCGHEPSHRVFLEPEVDAGAVLRSVKNEQADNDHAQDADEIDKKPDIEVEDANQASQSPPRRITRAQAQADKATATTHSGPPDDWVPPPLHPLFLIPPAAKPDPDFGLPHAEAEETRRMLAAYVQKQEEVCRGAEKLYEGLLLANRQKTTVFRWCKAEGHVGEMSDGEDWYDKEEWGLEEDLRKGHMEEEEDTVVQGKKTRGRRA
ncbi:MAG: hypothetical protein Q9163_005882 [Psora crenata]